MTKFKIGLLIVFGVFIILGMISFATSKGDVGGPKANLIIWGTVATDKFNYVISAMSNSLNKDDNLTISYIQKSAESFDVELAEALADGIGPDIILLPHDMIFRHKNKIFSIPYTNYTERLYKDSFVEASEIFLNESGVLAMPLLIDPLVMYWNRDIFKNNSITLPPKYWDEFLTLTPKINRKDSSGNFTQTTISFGEWKNISNAKYIISNLLLQSGTNIVNKTINGPVVSLNESESKLIAPGNSAINFYTQFANPTSPTYSWNRSLATSLNYFLSGNLATYMGFAGELIGIREKNPNLNFDVAISPEPRQNTKKVVFAKVYGLAIIKQSQNKSASFRAINKLTSEEFLKNFEQAFNLPPVRRSMLSNIPTDAYKSVFYQSAIVSKTWMDPDKKLTDEIFRSMIESITSGRSRLTEALIKAEQELNTLIKK